MYAGLHPPLLAVGCVELEALRWLAAGGGSGLTSVMLMPSTLEPLLDESLHFC